MKIGLVCPYSLSLPGGVQEHVRALAREFKKLGHQATVVSPASVKFSERGGELVLGKAVRVPTPNKSWSQVSLFFEKPDRRLRDIMARENFDVLHFHSPLAPFLNWQILQVSRSLNVGTFHSEWGNTLDPLMVDSLQFVLRPLMEKFKEKMKGLIAVSQVARNSWQEIFDGSLPEIVIPNGVDLERFSPRNDPRRVFGDKKTILYVGRIEARKGLKYLLHAFKEMQKEMGVRLVVAGSGPFLVRSKIWVETEGLAGKVFFTGRVPDDEVPSFYTGADVFCSPAISGESFGIVLLEAMASGVPLVVFGNPGYRELLGNCPWPELVVPVGDTGALVKVLRKMLTDADWRQKVRDWGLKEVQQYAWPKVALQVLDFYQTLSR